MADIAFCSATELARRIRRREISSLELTDHYISRIERLDNEINAVVVRDFERAREAARAADAALARGQLPGPLHGVPMTIKDSFNVAGLPTTWGVPEMKDNIADSDAVVTASFKRAGAHFLGKTNVPLNLADFQSYNDIYGTTGNPWDVGRTPGGSSGGSAAALAAGLTALEFGSDIGGSIRNPAHFCGVYGHKPTWNVVPPHGHALPGMVAPPDIAVVGPLARSSEDLALAMDLCAGPGPLDRGWRLDLARPRKASLADYRVAIWPTDASCPVDEEVADRARSLADTLANLGATVSDSARPAIDPQAAYVTYNYMLNGVMAAGLPEEARAAFREIDAAAPADDFSQAVLTARSSIQDHATWLRHHNRRELLRQAWRAFFDDWDILVCPQTSTPAFSHDHAPMGERTLQVNNEVQPYFQQLFWAGLATVAYLPSTVFPTGLSRAGLPIGLQAVGAEYDDYITIDFARLLARELGGCQVPPGFD